METVSQVGLAREPHAPISTLLRVRTPMQSAVQGENLDQLLSWQSSWQGSWQGCVRGGMALANFRQASMSAWEPSCFRHETAEEDGNNSA